MKQLLIIGNWKANKNHSETEKWFEEFSQQIETHGLNIENKEVVICASFTNLELANSCIKKHKLPIKIGAQDVSKFQNGAYTGEVTAKMLSGVVQYCIIGHSERRKYFKETNEEVMKKLLLLLQFKITPILCVSDLSQLRFYISKEPKIKALAKNIVFVYEPPSAISGGKDYKPESVEVASSNILKIKEILGQDVKVLYGGSINSENALSFFNRPEINGGLSGQASLDPLHFLKIINY